MEHPERVRRRLVPDEAQLQIMLGSLLGDARLEGEAGERRMYVSHAAERADYLRWKYERLAPFVGAPPVACGGQIAFRTISHPVFDDLAVLFAERRAHIVRDLLAPLGLAVWLTDLGRLQLRADLFLPTQRDLLLAA